MNKSLIYEVDRCFNCVNKPCMNACPLNNDIPSIISLVKESKFEEAYEVLTKTTVIPAIASLICPHEKQCKSQCTARFKGEAVDVGSIEHFLGKMAIDENWKFSSISSVLSGVKVAVIGSGPAGLTASAFLARNGANVTIFEKKEKLGGILRYGIPEFRLNKSLLDTAIDKILEIENHSIIVNCGIEFGKDITLDELKKKFDVILLSFGANVSKSMSIMGEELIGVFGGNELLESNLHPDYIDKVVVVSGGGNVAMDVARTVKRLGAKKVVVVYRRSENEMPAEIKEIKEAKDEGVEFLFHTNLIKIIGDSDVNGVECVKTFYDGERIRDNLKNIDGSNFEFDADFVIMAVGAGTEKTLVEDLNVELDSKGYIKIDENYKTSDENVFAIGDLSGEKSTVAWAASSGRKVAEYIINMYKERT